MGFYWFNGSLCSSAREPKMKELEWSQHFPQFESMEIFPDAQG